MSVKINITFLIIFNLFYNFLYSQVFYNDKANDIIINSKKVILDNHTGTPTFITYNINTTEPSDISKYLMKIYKLGNNHSIKLVKEEKDELGQRHQTWAQYYNQKPIRGCTLKVHSKNNMLLCINGIIRSDINPEKNNMVSSSDAIKKAIEHIKAEKYKWDIVEEEQLLKEESNDTMATHYPSPILIYAFNNGNSKKNEPILCYEMIIYAHKPLSKKKIYINAIDRSVLYSESMIHHTDYTGSANTLYSGNRNIKTSLSNNSYILKEYDRGNGIFTLDMNNSSYYGNATDFHDSDNQWNNTQNNDNAALDAHWGAEMTYDYFFNEHGRNSYDGQGAIIRSYVHYSNNYSNAFWDGSRLTYGDGDGYSFTPLTCLDIVAHELSHAVTTHTADLNYSYEPGALNESFSDIFGVAVEYSAKPNDANWLIGDEMTPNGLGIRSMSNPKSQSQPDTYDGTYWYNGHGDNGGVHYNSGVQNFWFYLLSVGGAGSNDNGDSYNVTSIGLEKAAKIAYRNLSVYLTSSSEYIDAKNGSIQAATDLYGANSAELQSTIDAWGAVGLGTGTGSGTPPTSSNLCQGLKTITDTTGFIEDGSGTSIYDNNMNCSWVIQTPGNQMIELEFTEFDTENNYDYVKVYDGANANASLIGAYSGDNVPSKIIAGSGSMYISFISDNTVQKGGWKAKYTCIFSIPTCSGTTYLNDTSAVFSDGSGLDNYSHNLNCKWVIAAPGAIKTQLIIDTFNISTGDHLYIYEGPDTTYPLFADYDINSKPDSILVNASKVMVKFKTDYFSNENGWNIKYEGLYQVSYCEDTIHYFDSTGTISDGSGPNNYLNNSNCFWLIKGAGQQKINFYLDSSEIKDPSDFLNIYDGINTNAPLVKSINSYSGKDTITTTSGAMLLHFSSNGSVTTGGWEGHYKIVEDIYPTSCNDTLVMDSTYGIFSDGSDSSSFPNYSPGLDCYWHIKTPGHNAYKVLFKKLATEQNNDVVSIYSGNSSSSLLIGYYSGFNLPDTININSNEVFIRFETNNNIQHDGWEIEYFAQNTQIAGCTDTIFLADTTGVITDGSGNLNYLNNLDCYWLLDPPGNKPINFSFSSFRTESNYDYLYAYDGIDTSADLIGTFHGNTIPGGIYSANSGRLFLHFKSDNIIQTEGWELNYTSGDSIPKTVLCKGWVSLTDTNGIFSDGSGANKYNNGMDCYWQIEPPGAKQVTLSFVALETEKNYDQIKIYDGNTTNSNLLATIDGYTIPSPIVSNTGVMLVNFISDHSLQKSGFTAIFSSSDSILSTINNHCLSTITLSDSASAITDGSGGMNYSNELDCNWLISPPGASLIKLNFQLFDTEAGYDFLKVYDGVSKNGKLIGSFDGKTIPPPMIANSGSMFLSFHTDKYVNAQGWEGKYQAFYNNSWSTPDSSLSCNGQQVLSADSGTITDGSSNLKYNNDQDCFWLIKPNNADSIKLSIYYLNTEPGKDFVRFYNGEYTGDPIFAEHSGNINNQSFVVPSNKVLVHFHSDESVTMDGWVINYKSIKQGTWTGTSSYSNDNGDIKVYYNNSTSQLILRSDKALPEDTRISLYDILGKCIQRSKLYLDKENTYSINIRKLPKGIYSIFIEKGNSFIHNDMLYIH